MKRISVFFLTLFMLIASFCVFTGCGNRDRDEAVYMANLLISYKAYADKLAEAEAEMEYWKEKVDEAEKELEEIEAELESGYLYWEYENLKGSK